MRFDTPILDHRPVNPSAAARATMATAADVARAILLVADLAQRTLIPELTIRPTCLRDTSAEVGLKRQHTEQAEHPAVARTAGEAVLFGPLVPG